MSLIITEDYRPLGVPPNTDVIARCFRIIDLGTQLIRWDLCDCRARMVELFWELLCSERMNGENPFVVSKRYIASLGPGTNLRQDIESWLGRSLTSRELDNFDLRTMLGSFCLIGVGYTEARASIYGHILDITPLPEDIQRPEPFYKVSHFDIDDPNCWDMFDNFEEEIRRTITNSTEWESIFRNHDGKFSRVRPNRTDLFDEFDDEVPF